MTRREQTRNDAPAVRSRDEESVSHVERLRHNLLLAERRLSKYQGREKSDPTRKRAEREFERALAALKFEEGRLLAGGKL